jgi:hypothetical protein
VLLSSSPLHFQSNGRLHSHLTAFLGRQLVRQLLCGLALNLTGHSMSRTAAVGSRTSYLILGKDCNCTSCCCILPACDSRTLCHRPQ